MKFLKSINEDQIKALIDAGYNTVDDLKRATKQDLANIEGIDSKLAGAILKESVSFKHKTFTQSEKRLLGIRARHQTPYFKRDDFEKKKRLSPSWRRPKGLFNKMRRGFPAKGAVVQVGYSAPKSIKGFHPSGFEETLVFNSRELDNVEQHQAVRIARTVGGKKKKVIIEKAFAKGLKVLNPKLTARIDIDNASDDGVQEAE